MDARNLVNCGNHWGVLVAFLWLVHSIFEYFIGKTDKTKAASTWELIFFIVASSIALIIKKKNGKNDSEKVS